MQSIEITFFVYTVLWRAALTADGEFIFLITALGRLGMGVGTWREGFSAGGQQN